MRLWLNMLQNSSMKQYIIVLSPIDFLEWLQSHYRVNTFVCYVFKH